MARRPIEVVLRGADHDVKVIGSHAQVAAFLLEQVSTQKPGNEAFDLACKWFVDLAEWVDALDDDGETK